MAACEAIARKNGWNGEGDGMLDALNDCYARVERRFPTKDAAVAWLRMEIDAMKSLFGCGDVDEFEEVEPRRRCRYCTCRGAKEVASWIVDDEGVSDEREVADECWNGDD